MAEIVRLGKYLLNLEGLDKAALDAGAEHAVVLTYRPGTLGPNPSDNVKTLKGLEAQALREHFGFSLNAEVPSVPFRPAPQVEDAWGVLAKVVDRPCPATAEEVEADRPEALRYYLTANLVYLAECRRLGRLPDPVAEDATLEEILASGRDGVSPAEMLAALVAAAAEVPENLRQIESLAELASCPSEAVLREYGLASMAMIHAYREPEAPTATIGSTSGRRSPKGPEPGQLALFAPEAGGAA